MSKTEKKLKNYQAQNLLEASSILSGLTGFAFAMGVAKGKKILVEEQEVLNEIHKPSKEYEAYQAESRDIYKQFSLKDDKGEPNLEMKQVGNRQFQFYAADPKKKKEQDEALAKLEKKHKALIEEQKAKEKKYNEAMLENSTFEPYEIAEKQMPKDISVAQMDIALYFFKIKS